LRTHSVPWPRRYPADVRAPSVAIPSLPGGRSRAQHTFTSSQSSGRSRPAHLHPVASSGRSRTASRPLRLRFYCGSFGEPKISLDEARDRNPDRAIHPPSRSNPRSAPTPRPPHLISPDTPSVVCGNIEPGLEIRIPFYGMDPVRNPFAPGAGQRPPELAGRERELQAFEVVLERVARGRPERSLVLTGLRGVGKTVLLGELRSMAMRRGWGTGKIEARPESELRRPLSAALHRAIRDLAVR